jgi:hypothetical protein
MAATLLPVDDYPTKPSLSYINKNYGPSPAKPRPSLQHLGNVHCPAMPKSASKLAFVNVKVCYILRQEHL